MLRIVGTDSLIFPTTSSFIIFWSYILLFVSQGLLVKAVHKNDVQNFNTIVTVLLQELVKLTICIAIYLVRSRGNVASLLKELNFNRNLLLYYLAPAFLYCLYNNLTFFNLKHFDLATYYCLMQFRIVLTAFIYQALFHRRLNGTQWASLVILTIGCLIKEYGMYKATSTTLDTNRSNISQNSTKTAYEAVSGNSTTILRPGKETEQEFNHFVTFLQSSLLILLQMFCSCFAGVYNEYLLKDMTTASNADVIVQNMFMYIDSIICNLAAYKISPASGTISANEKNTQSDINDILGSSLTNFVVVALIISNALSGLMASFFLKSLNSILKTFASALELFAVTFFAWVLFGDRVDLATITALVLVSVAITVYSRNPVSTGPPEKKDGFVLLPTTEEEEFENAIILK